MKYIQSKLIVLGLVLPWLVKAHAIGEVYSLPVPLKYYLLGSGLAVALSFFILSIFLNKSKSDEQAQKIPPGAWWSFALKILRVAAVLMLALMIVSGYIGSRDSLRNFAPLFFWVYFLIGTSIFSAFVGNIWDEINPWKTITNWLGIIPGDKKISGVVGVVLLLGLYWLELASPFSFDPLILSILLTAYTLVNIICSQRYANWYKDGELFSVLFGFIGKLSNLQFTSLADKWMLGVACVLLAGTSFDSLKETVMWSDWTTALHLGVASTTALSIGIILAPLPFLLSYLLAVWVMRLLVGNQYQTTVLARQFVWSLIPIAFGYTLAHNFSLFIVSLPRIIAFISDPFGFGWNLVGTANFRTQDLLLSARTIWFIEIGFIVLAHVVGVWFAHVIALNTFKDSKQASKSQYPMVILMVGYTIMTLWLLAQPLVV